MGKFTITTYERSRLEKVQVVNLSKGDVCCWPRGSHLFQFHSNHPWGETHLRYLYEDESFAEPYSVKKYAADEVYRLRKAGDNTPLLQLLNPTTTEGNTTMTKLYQTKEATPRFGLLLATNSAGLFVLEMKGTNEVLTFAKGDVEEVKPYTVRVKFIDALSNDKGYDFISRKGDVEVGDLLMLKGYSNMARVEAVDTKSDRATKDLVGRKVATVPFGETVTE
jgi:hypothetical protein